MTSRSSPKRPAPSIEEFQRSDSPGMKDDEKTIPFLRRLVDMLSENDEVISFYPGFVKNGHVTLGRIVVHDRLKVEAMILPKYFNHSSFASLRRQLNYFSFTRMGKGRQRGATYCNEAVISLSDILRLKRRSSVVGNSGSISISASSGSQPAVQPTSESTLTSLPLDDIKHRVKRPRYENTSNHLTAPTAIVSPRTSPVHPSSGEGGEPQIILDLTVPSSSGTKEYSLRRDARCSLGGWNNPRFSPKFLHGDDDILAGCNALLSFSRGFGLSTAV